MCIGALSLRITTYRFKVEVSQVGEFTQFFPIEKASYLALIFHKWDSNLEEMRRQGIKINTKTGSSARALNEYRVYCSQTSLLSPRRCPRYLIKISVFTQLSLVALGFN